MLIGSKISLVTLVNSNSSELMRLFRRRISKNDIVVSTNVGSSRRICGVVYVEYGDGIS